MDTEARNRMPSCLDCPRPRMWDNVKDTREKLNLPEIQTETEGDWRTPARDY